MFLLNEKSNFTIKQEWITLSEQILNFIQIIKKGNVINSATSFSNTLLSLHKYQQYSKFLTCFYMLPNHNHSQNKWYFLWS